MHATRPRLSLVRMEGRHGGMVKDYLRWLASWGAAERTMIDRRRVIEALLRTYGPADTITTANLVDWLSQPDFSPWTRHTYYSHAASFFGWAATEGLIDRDPMLKVRRPATPSGLPRPWTDDEVDRILSTATGNWRTWVILGLYAGLRAHEMAQVRGEDVQQGSLYVMGKGRHAAYLPTHPAIWEAAQDYPRRGWWFPAQRGAVGHVKSTSVSRVASAHLSRLGIAGSIHRARHTYGTRLLRGGANIRVVQTLMRHRSLSSTELYLGVEDDERTLAISRLSSPAA